MCRNANGQILLSPQWRRALVSAVGAVSACWTLLMSAKELRGDMGRKRQKL